MPTWLRNRGLDIKEPNELHYEAPASILAPLIIKSDLRLGAYSYLQGGLIQRIESIGRYCSIGHNFSVGLAPHPLTWLSTSPFQYGYAKFNFYPPFAATPVRKRSKENDRGYRRQ